MKKVKPKIKINYRYEPNKERLDLALKQLAENFRKGLKKIKKEAEKI